jgi:ABC-2 type transport system ATP-binding protein
VEAVCSRVIIIERGRIAVDDTLEGFRTGNAIVIETRGPAEAIRRTLESTPGVAKVSLARVEGDHATFEVQASGEGDVRETLAARLIQNGWPLRRLDLRRTSLEDRFIQAVTQQAVTAHDHDAATALEAV